MRIAKRSLGVVIPSLVAAFFIAPMFVSAAVDIDSSRFIAPPVDMAIEPSAQTGALEETYSFALPKGRNGVQPELALRYSSAHTDQTSIVGYGWDISLPSIRRVAKYGVDELYETQEFTSTLSGELASIATDGMHGTYGAHADDGSMLRYTYLSDESWEVVDKQGTTYVFGGDANARVADPDDASHVFTWMLTRVEDSSGNVVTYTYTKDAGQVYPQGINYTGFASDPGIFDVTFTLEDRDDVLTSYAAGFPVTTAYRIGGVTVTVEGNVVRSYALAFDTGDNGTRSLLASITETATSEDGTSSLTKPATVFSYATADRSWSSATVDFPETIAGTSAGSLGVYLFDMNGDAVSDIVKARNGSRAIHTGNSDGTWSAASVTTPIDFASPIGKDMGVRVMDANGDGLLDIVQSRLLPTDILEESVHINNGDGTGWTESATMSVPIPFTTDGGIYLGVEIGDVNGDGLPDIVRSREGAPTEVYTNNGDGTGWTLSSTYTVPVYFASSATVNLGVRMMEVNGDGLMDLVRARSDSRGDLEAAIYINNGDGTGWTEDTTRSFPVPFLLITGGDAGVREVDVNGDGLTDLIRHFSGATSDTTGAYINTGSSWVYDASIVTPLAFTNGAVDFGVRIDDFNADGLSDFLKSRDTGSGVVNELYLAQGQVADMLTEVTTSQGASTTISYASSAQGENAGLPFIVQTVDTLSNNDGLGNTSTTQYAYADGDYYYASPFNRRFAGFGRVIATDSDGITTTYAHQGNATESSLGEYEDSERKIGRIYREERSDLAGNIYRVTMHKWDAAHLSAECDFVYASQMLELVYGSGSAHVDRAESFTYSASGNMTQYVEWGDVAGTTSGSFSDIGTDKRTTQWTYATSATLGETAYKSSEKLLNASDAHMQHTRWFYDTLPFGQVSEGDISRKAEYINAGTAYNTFYAYNAQGLLVSETDHLGNSTTYSYDDALLYPEYVTNALGHVTEYTYDYSSGFVHSVTDPNGFTTTTAYDAYDRPISITNIQAGETKTVKAYAYNDSAIPALVQTTEWLSDTVGRDTFTYADGFGRTLQVRTESEDGYRVTDTRYDAKGRVESVSLPYVQSGSAYTDPTTTDALLVVQEYDTLNRPTRTQNAVGVSTVTYSGRTETHTDAVGNVLVYTYDALGRVVSVAERVGSAGAYAYYTTTYGYNSADRLNKITDPAGNVRNFTYDFRGSRLSAKDLHAASDMAYGTWSYTYNALGAMATQTSPTGIVTTFMYDALGRKISEDTSASSGIDVAYAYDDCTNGRGHVCSATVFEGPSTAYTYTETGAVASESRTIDAITYTTSYVYDFQGGIAQVTYPDASVAVYEGDESGALESVAFTDGRTGDITHPVTEVTYGPHGKPIETVLGSGAITQYTYDAEHMYRLSDLVTMQGATTLQNFAYTYDAIGNITHLADTSDLYADLNIAYTYNPRKLITGATATSTDSALTYAKTWTYNTIGGIKTSTDCGSYTYGGTSAGNYANPHAPTGACGKVFAYDQAGHLVSDGTWTHTWNGRGLLAQSASASATVTYAYDENGNRVEQTSSVSGTTITPNAYYTIDGDLVKRTIIAGELDAVATAIFDTTTTTTDVVYHHRDHLGGTHVETGADGEVLEYILYTPFGDTLIDSKTGTYENNHKYTGKEKDTDTGLYYYGARYYDPRLGTFISQDPVFVGMGTHAELLAKSIQDPQSLNSYSYSRNNPINISDPTGNCIWDLCIGEGAAFVAAATITWTAAAALAVAIPNLIGAVDALAHGDTAAVNMYTDTVMGSLAISGIVTSEALPILLMNSPIAPATSYSRSGSRIQNVNVSSYGQTIYRGPRDLGPTLNSLDAGTLTPRMQNGSPKTFGNFEGWDLGGSPSNYFTEYDMVDPIASQNLTSPERLLVGGNGEVYYSPDHYMSQPIKIR